MSVLIVWVAAHRIDAGVMQVGSMTAFITYSMLIVMSFLMLTMMSVMLPRAMVAADRIDEVINTHSSIEDSENPETIESAKGVVEFNHVNFMYPGAKANALEDITFKAEPGKTTAIIGLSLIHISEPTRRTPISYAVFCLKKKKNITQKK